MLAERIIYLDNNASTEPDPDVVMAVSDAMFRFPANPASQHEAGIAAANAVEAARGSITELLGCRAHEVVFTSGATESNNLALNGAWEASREIKTNRNRIVVGATEHPSVHEVAARLASLGADIVVVSVDRMGVLDLDQIEEVVNDRTLVISMMSANNETGVISPLTKIVEIAQRHGAFVHCDATQAIGRLPVCFAEMGFDLMSISSHKMHGPKGVGALIASRHVQLVGIMRGGGQERGLRPGTLNTPGIIGFGVAARLAAERLGEAQNIAMRRDKFVDTVKSMIVGVEENGVGAPRLPNTANLRFVGADAEAVMAGIPQVACSTGAACSSSVPTPSPVLLAMGLSRIAASESLRFSLSRNTTEGELNIAADMISRSVEYVRKFQEVVAD